MNSSAVRMFVFLSAFLGVSSVATAQSSTVSTPAFCGSTDLGELIACRLLVSDLVGRDKYATGAAIEDKAREAVVIANGVTAAKPYQIEAATAERYWAAQIEASKTVQRAVIANLARQGTARINSGPKVADLRGVLDQLTASMTRQMGSMCRADAALLALRAYPTVNVPALLVAVDGLPDCSAYAPY